jgi:hypothetical protein
MRRKVNEGKVGYYYDSYHRTISGITLRRSVVIEEHFEFAIRGAHTVKISAATSAALPPYNRHSKYGVE